MIFLVLPLSLGSHGANYAKDLLRAAVLVQYIPRLYRFLPLLAGQSPSGFIFESAWANFVINLLTFVLSGHVVGSCWYLFGLQVGGEHQKLFCQTFLSFFLSFPLLSLFGSSSRLYAPCFVMHLYKCLVVEVSMVPLEQELLPSIKARMQA